MAQREADGTVAITIPARAGVATRNRIRLTLRPARPNDYDFALGFYLDNLKPLLTALGQWDESAVLARFRRVFKPEQTKVIRSGGRDIGWLHVSENPDGFHLHQLHLMPELRNRGIGTRLLAILLDRARRNRRAVSLNVIRGNPAIELYKRLGFAVVGEDHEKFNMRWQPGARRTSGARPGP